jgi:methyltransferase
MIFYSVFIFYILYRIMEMRLAKSREAALGFPKEVAVVQRKLMVVLHTAWFISMPVEYNLSQNVQLNTQLLPLLVALLLFSAIVRYFSMKSLGKYWNTKIFDLPRVPLIKKGLYKYFPYPNYAIVVIEIFVIPFLFNLNITAIIFSVLNFIFLITRIKVQNRYQLAREGL